MLGFLNQWWNLPFLVMLGLVVTFFGMQMIGLASDDGDHDVEAEGDADAEPDAEGDAAHPGASDDGGDHGDGVKAFLGVGRAPFSVIWTTLFAFTGLVGLGLNYFFFASAGADYGAWHFALASAGGLSVGAVAVRSFSRVAAKLVDVGGKGAITKQELAGRSGIVASPELNNRFGEVRVRDDHGNEILVHGCLRDDEPALARGDKAVLVDYDEGRGLFWVSAHPVPGDRPRDATTATTAKRAHVATNGQRKRS